MTRRTTTSVLTAMGLLLAACSGGDSPSAGAQVSDQKPTPAVGGTQAAPATRQSAEARRTIGEGLAADRANARYTEEIIRRAPQQPLPPAATITADGVKIAQGFPSGTPAPQPNRVVPSSQSPLAASVAQGRQAGPDAPPPAPTEYGVPASSAAAAQPMAGGAQPVPITSAPPPGASAPSGLDAKLDAMLSDSYKRPALEGGASPVVPAPEPVAEEILPSSVRVATIYFADGSSALDTASRTVLRDVVRMHQQQGGLIRVVGHASRRVETLDPVKREVANLSVSAARTGSVVTALRRMGVTADAIQSEAIADRDATYDEASPAGEAANRRVEIYLEY